MLSSHFEDKNPSETCVITCVVLSSSGGAASNSRKGSPALALPAAAARDAHMEAGVPQLQHGGLLGLFAKHHAQVPHVVKEKKERKVYAFRRHNRSLCTQKQPETYCDVYLLHLSQVHVMHSLVVQFFALLPLLVYCCRFLCLCDEVFAAAPACVSCITAS